MTDIYYDNVVLMLPFDQDAPGPRGFLDYSSKHESLNTGLATKTPYLDASQYKYGLSSCYFDGPNSWLQTVEDLTRFVFGSGDFTIEAWVKTGSNNVAIFDFYASGQNGWQVFITTAGVCQFYINSGFFYTGTIAVNNNVWHHLAWSRSGSSLKLFIDGVLDTAFTDATNLYYIAATFALGAQVTSRNPAYDYIGYLDDVRITKGVARYTADFTPPTALKADYPPPPAFQGHNVPFSLYKSNLQWSGLPRKGVKSPIALGKATVITHPNWGGPGAVSGIVKMGITPVSRKVRLYDSSSGVLVQERWSGADGAYSFQGLNTAYKFTVMTVDHENNYNNVVASNINAV